MEFVFGFDELLEGCEGKGDYFVAVQRGGFDDLKRCSEFLFEELREIFQIGNLELLLLYVCFGTLGDNPKCFSYFP